MFILGNSWRMMWRKKNDWLWSRKGVLMSIDTIMLSRVLAYLGNSIWRCIVSEQKFDDVAMSLLSSKVQWHVALHRYSFNIRFIFQQQFSNLIMTTVTSNVKRSKTTLNKKINTNIVKDAFTNMEISGLIPLVGYLWPAITFWHLNKVVLDWYIWLIDICTCLTL